MQGLPLRSTAGSSPIGAAGRAVLYIVLFIIAVVQLFPIYWLLTFSLKSNQQIFSSHPLSFPLQPKWENYEKVWSAGNIGTYFLNSLWITVVATLLTVVIASFATYAITRMNWKLSKLALGMIMVAMMIPVHSTLIPLYSMFNFAHLIDHPLSIIISYIAFNLPITVLIMLGFYYTIPREIEEAAVMDGSSIHRLVLTIIFPMTGTVVATTGIVNMIYNWNEFIFVNTFISSNELKTLTVGVQNFIGQYTTDWGAIGATLMISILPILIAFIFLSDRIVEGLAAGSIKG
ncbi:sugar ABC transporter permease [Paenibacillus montaniterrae]|uniref:Sugar ABC transporter permease n=1 Tax=Paenibacillus montaniterrae TaxID=429341 RepID=A0A920CY70_9BACL|nr:carbohydrate ABC transporter permease [Paenibacillus montaniterrae]GIP17631.1 sugar ABC transporter permease [Paenibacillus montaniterrae]